MCDELDEEEEALPPIRFCDCCCLLRFFNVCDGSCEENVGFTIPAPVREPLEAIGCELMKLLLLTFRLLFALLIDGTAEAAEAAADEDECVGLS